MTKLAADDLIAVLGLKPLPQEGGNYRETYRSPDVLLASALPAHYGADKSAGTAMYYLLTPDTFSALHRLPTDEIYHFYLGSPVRMLQLFPDGRGGTVILGPDLRAGQQVQCVVPRGVWQGSALEPGGDYALLGTTVAPGFDCTDYEAGDRASLTRQYPVFADFIQRLTRD
jgi:predicted cupin superfamily sugar epimerase